MKKFTNLFLIFCILISVFGVTGCMSVNNPGKYPSTHIELEKQNFEILGRVTVSNPAFSIMGIGPFGGVTISDLYDKAAVSYSDFDEVVNIYSDNKIIIAYPFFLKYELVLSGLVIKYVD